MSEPYPDALSLSHRALKVLITLNWLFGAGILVLLIWTFAAAEWVARALGAGTDHGVIVAMRAIMLVGIACAPITNVFLSRLLAIVETVRAGDAFVAGNADRLRVIAWAVVALEVARLVVAGIANSVSTPAHPIHIGRNFTVTPWLAVLLLFVLARVFAHGARMREDLEGTV